MFQFSGRFRICAELDTLTQQQCVEFGEKYFGLEFEFPLRTDPFARCRTFVLTKMTINVKETIEEALDEIRNKALDNIKNQKSNEKEKKTIKQANAAPFMFLDELPEDLFEYIMMMDITDTWMRLSRVSRSYCLKMYNEKFVSMVTRRVYLQNVITKNIFKKTTFTPKEFLRRCKELYLVFNCDVGNRLEYGKVDKWRREYMHKMKRVIDRVNNSSETDLICLKECNKIEIGSNAMLFLDEINPDVVLFDKMKHWRFGQGWYGHKLFQDSIENFETMMSACKKYKDKEFESVVYANSREIVEELRPHLNAQRIILQDIVVTASGLLVAQSGCTSLTSLSLINTEVVSPEEISIQEQLSTSKIFNLTITNAECSDCIINNEELLTYLNAFRSLKSIRLELNIREHNKQKDNDLQFQQLGIFFDHVMCNKRWFPNLESLYLGLLIRYGNEQKYKENIDKVLELWQEYEEKQTKQLSIRIGIQIQHGKQKWCKVINSTEDVSTKLNIFCKKKFFQQAALVFLEDKMLYNKLLHGEE